MLLVHVVIVIYWFSVDSFHSHIHIFFLFIFLHSLEIHRSNKFSPFRFVRVLLMFFINIHILFSIFLTCDVALRTRVVSCWIQFYFHELIAILPFTLIFSDGKIRLWRLSTALRRQISHQTRWRRGQPLWSRRSTATK